MNNPPVLTKTDADRILKRATEIEVRVVRPLLRRPRWTAWVQAAADRLETLVLMVAAQNPANAPALEPPGPDP